MQSVAGNIIFASKRNIGFWLLAVGFWQEPEADLVTLRKHQITKNLQNYKCMNRVMPTGLTHSTVIILIFRLFNILTGLKL